MSDIIHFNVMYDRESDVLYITTRREQAARGIEDKNGIVWRYDRRGELIGATVLDFYDHWFDRRSLLAGEISRHFHIPEPQAIVVLQHAMEGMGR